MYPVEVAYLAEPTSDYVESAVQTIFDIHGRVRLALAVSNLSSLMITHIVAAYPCLLYT